MDFGAELREARERKGITLRQISGITRISMRALEALERNDVSRLPGGIFTRGIIRSYSQEVGLDPDQTTRDFLTQFPTEAEPYSPQVAEDSFESRQRIAAALVGIVILAVVIGGASLLYFSLRGGRASRAAAIPAAADQQPAPTSGAAPRTNAPAIPAPGNANGRVPPANPESLTLVVSPRAQCWVALTADGQKQFGRVLAAGDRETAQARNDLVVEVGDAAVFQYSINDFPGKTLGVSGQVVTLRINRQNYRSYLAAQ